MITMSPALGAVSWSQRRAPRKVGVCQDGPINGECFLAYVEQQLIPVLSGHGMQSPADDHPSVPSAKRDHADLLPRLVRHAAAHHPVDNRQAWCGHRTARLRLDVAHQVGAEGGGLTRTLDGTYAPAFALSGILSIVAGFCPSTEIEKGSGANTVPSTSPAA